MATLPELREKIDCLDDDIVGLLMKRADLVLQVKETKKREKIDIYSPARERSILDRILAIAETGSFPKEPLERIFINIISATRSLIGDLHICCLGSELSLGAQAALRHFGEDVHISGAASTEDAFAKLSRGDVHFAVLPASASSGGLVAETFDMLMPSSMQIIGEVEVQEGLALFSNADALADIEKVYIAGSEVKQVLPWLTANVSQAEVCVVPTLDSLTDELASNPKIGIVTAEAAGIKQNLKTLATGLDQTPQSGTRFVVIGAAAAPKTDHDKTSIACYAEERAGALRDILQPFSARGITLLRIESRPMRNRAWEYVFFIDFEGHQEDDVVREALDDLKTITSYCKVLGSYPHVCFS
jgi:chorismate mutase/prephenate dehydratase